MVGRARFRLRGRDDHPPSAYLSGTPVVSGQVNGTANFTITAIGGTAPWVYAVSSGTLPTGQSINSSTGAVTGTLSAAATFGPIILKATDALGVVVYLASYSAVITTPASAFTITITPPAAALTTGSAISTFTALAVGATGAVVYAVKDTSYYPLPNGLSLNSSTGDITGTPTQDGYFSNIIIQGTDTLSVIGYTAAFDIIVHLAGAVVAPAHTPYIQQRTDSFTTTANAVVSLQAQTFNQRNNANPDPEGSMWYGSTSWPVLTSPPDPVPLALCTYPYRAGSTVNQTIRGGLFQGEVSITADRHVLDLYYANRVTEGHNYINSGGLLIDSGTSNKILVYRCRFDRCWDSIQGVNSATPYQTSIISECWITNCRDDAIEHDLTGDAAKAQTPLTISDCLVDGCQDFLSLDGGGGVFTDNTANLVSVDSCVIRCATYPQSSSTDPLHNKALAPFKVTSLSSSLAVTNTIVAVEFDLATVTASDKAAMHSYYIQLKAKMTNGVGSSSNNKFCWTSDDTLPGTGWLGDFGTGGTGITGWTVQTGATARATLVAAREAWIVAHPWVRKRTAYTPGSIST